jgi:2,3-bisphosphoglycerate-dependent phosphoglycerate mutase
MQLYLIRHAESTNNAKPPRQRVEDPPITELGESQATHLAKWTSTTEIDTLITGNES